jgi:hypothetical protein
MVGTTATPENENLFIVGADLRVRPQVGAHIGAPLQNGTFTLKPAASKFSPMIFPQIQ